MTINKVKNVLKCWSEIREYPLLQEKFNGPDGGIVNSVFLQITCTKGEHLIGVSDFSS
jgi:hypothetical protein